MGRMLGAELPPQAVDFLRVGRLVVVATVNDQGWPNTAPFSWAIARDRKTLRIAAHAEAATLRNIRDNGRVMVSVMGGGMSLSIRGSARVIKERMEAVPFATSMVEIVIEQVKDDEWFGREGPEGSVRRWTDRRQLASDTAVFAEMTSWQPGEAST